MTLTTYTPTYEGVDYREGLLGVNNGKQFLDIYYPDTPMPEGGYPLVVWKENVGLVGSTRAGSISASASQLHARYLALTRGYALVDCEVSVPVDGGDPNPGTPVGDGYYNDIPDQDLDGGGNDCCDIDARWIGQWLWWKAAEYGLNMHRSCVVGTSGGGIIAAWAGLNSDAKDLANSIPRRRMSSRFKACAILRSGGLFPSLAMDSAAGGLANPIFRKASNPALKAVDGEDCVQHHLLHASSGWFSLQGSARPMNKRTPVFLSTDATPGVDAVGGPLIYTVNATTLLPDDVGTPTHGVAATHDPHNNIVRIRQLRLLDAWHDTHSLLVARGTYTVDGFTPDEIIAAEVDIAERLIDWLDVEMPAAGAPVGTVVPHTAHWFAAAQDYATYPSTGAGGATDDPLASEVEFGEKTIIESLYVDALAGEFPAVTIVDDIGSELLTVNCPAEAGGSTDFFAIQSGVTDYGASADGSSAAITTVDTSRAFPKLNNIRYTNAGRSTPDAVLINNVDVGEVLFFFSVALLGFTRYSGAENIDHRVAWQVIENIAPPSSPNVYTVHGISSGLILDTATSGTFPAITAIGDVTKTVIWPLAFANNRAASGWDSATCKIVLNGDKTVTFTRGGTAGDLTISFAVIEFTGANWIVRTFADTLSAAAGTRDPVTLSGDAIDFAHAMIVGTWQIPSGEVGNEDSGVMFLKPVTGTTTIDQVVATGADNVAGGGYQTSGWVIYNPDINVLHDDSLAAGAGTVIDGAGTMSLVAAGDQSKTYTTAAVDLARTFLICYGAGTGTTSTVPKMNLNYRFASTTTVEFWRGSTASGGGINLAVQIVSGPAAGFASRPYGKAVKIGTRGLEVIGPVGARVNETGTTATVHYRRPRV